MTVTNERSYSGIEDQSRMIQLAQSLAAETLHVIDLPYRMSSWALDDPGNINLWEDETGRLLAWAVMQTPFWAIDYVYQADAAEDLHQRILDWADRRARQVAPTAYGHPQWFVNVFADQAARRQELEQNGYTDQAEMGEDSWSKVWMERCGSDGLPYYPLPAGFTLRTLAGESEVEAYVRLHQEVFGTRNMTTEWRRRTLQQPTYLPELDVVVAAPEGQLVAFCIGWLMQLPGAGINGQVEPLGCDKKYRSYALGRIALCETLRRLKQHGARKVFVETDNYRNTAFNLYESVGFRVVHQVRVYGRDYNLPAA